MLDMLHHHLLLAGLTALSSGFDNQAPRCDAGPDRVAADPSDSVTLVSDCRDVDGQIVAWRWTQLAGPDADLHGVDTPTLLVSSMEVGLYQFALEVEDDQGATARDEVVAFATGTQPEGTVEGTMRTWHRIGITFDGPSLDEHAEPNPFLDHRLTVYFVHEDGSSFTVPGHFAADGQAADTSATSGSAWRAWLSPDRVGTWHYWAQFRAGDAVAVDDAFEAGTSAAFDGAYGSFDVAATDKNGRDLRGKGKLQYVGQRYLRFAGNGEYFLKGGADSPENLLGYVGFDGTPNADHTYAPHRGDYDRFGGGPTWGTDARGKELLGALSYLSDQGMNSVYFLTMNRKGDGNDVWPWTAKDERVRFDVSKLEQWERVFSHMDERGLMLHVVTQETENDHLLDEGELGPQRRLYYRELISRFSHHLAITWNLGEENTNGSSQVTAFHDYLHQHDPYQHPVVLHTYPGEKEERYPPLLDSGTLHGASLQVYDVEHVHVETLRWIEEAEAHGMNWVVSLDEIGPAAKGVLPDDTDFDHDEPRQYALWGNLLAGGAGCEWYFGYGHPHDDLDCEDWRSREQMWRQTDIALSFFRDTGFPFWKSRPADDLTARYWDFCLADEGNEYVIFRKTGGAATKLTLASGAYEVWWFDPRKGGALQKGSVERVSGPGEVRLGLPPSDEERDWVIYLRKDNHAPVVDSYFVGPDPFEQPGDLELHARVLDEDGADDVHHVRMYFWDEEFRLVSSVLLPRTGDDTFGVEYAGVRDIPKGTYYYSVLAIDKSGMKAYGDAKSWVVLP